MEEEIARLGWIVVQLYHLHVICIVHAFNVQCIVSVLQYSKIENTGISPKCWNQFCMLNAAHGVNE